MLTPAVLPEARPAPELVCEGDTDRAVFEGLAAKGLLESFTAYPKRGQHGGVSEQPAQVGALVNIGRTRLIVARDLDDAQDGATLLRRLAHDLAPEASIISEPAPLLLEFRGCRIALVPQGLPGDTLLGRHAVTRHTVDDYLLKLLEQSVGDPPALFGDAGERDRAFSKLDEMRGLMVKQGYPANTSKQLVFLLKAIRNYAVADATLARQAIDNAPVEAVRSVFQPLVAWVNSALQALGCT